MSEPIIASATFTLPMPPSANRIWRNGRGRTHLSAEYKAWKLAAGLHLNIQRVPSIEPPYAVEYAFGRKDKRKSDLLNREKALSDLLQSSEVITNDCEIHDAHLFWSTDVEPGMVRCTVRTK